MNAGTTGSEGTVVVGDDPEPFNITVNVSTGEEVKVPAAKHFVSLMHDTPPKKLLRDVLGLETIDQLEPFHDSINIASLLPLLTMPVAAQED